LVKECPKCRLVNPPEALRCDCGYDFASGQMKRSYLTGAQLQSVRSLTPGEWFVCIVLPIIGLPLGFMARRRGRREAGTTMIAVSGLMCAIGLTVRLLMMAAP
jgi:hypothetical protein